MKDRLNFWWAAARYRSFTTAIVPVVVGTLLAADDAFSFWKAILAAIGSVAILAGTNFVNDYFDYKKGADNDRSLGMRSSIQRGVAEPKAVLTAGVASFVIGITIGLVLCAVTDWSLLWLGLASVLAGFLYTGAPVHLAYIALGELTVFVFMGPIIVLGAYFVQTERWDWEPVLVSLPIAFLVTAILHANNLRDIENDRETGKRTLASLLGRERAKVEMYVLLAGCYVALIIAAIAGALPWPGLIALATAPLAFPIAKIVATPGDPRRLNFALIKAVQLHLRFGTALAFGLCIHLALEA